MTKTLDSQSVSLGHSVIRYSHLSFDSFDLEALDRFAQDGEPVEPFRASDFGFWQRETITSCPLGQDPLLKPVHRKQNRVGHGK